MSTASSAASRWSTTTSSPADAAKAGRRLVCVVWDGLRPDLVSAETTPTLWRLAQAGVWHARARSVFPSETRVATSSFSTGCYPGKHGIPANSIYVPEVDRDRPSTTGSADVLRRIGERDGRILLPTTLGEALRDAGGVLAVASAGSSGNALLLNPGAIDGGTGYVVNWGVTFPESSRAEVRARFGEPPARGVPNRGPNDWVTRVFCEWLLPEVVARREPAVGVLWLSDPDVTLHHGGFGTPALREALGQCDARLARVIEAMAAAGMPVEGRAANTSLLVLSDHGHTTNLPLERRIAEDLIDEGWEAPEPGEIIFAGKAIWAAPAMRSRLPALAERLLRHPAVGPLFAANPADMPGVLPLGVVHHGGVRAPDLLFSPATEERDHPSGVPGHTWMPDFGREITGHGSLSIHDMRTTLVAAGPGFRAGLRSNIPVGIVDVAPTALHLLGVPIPGEWDGRPLLEALRDGPEPGALNVSEGSVGGTVVVDGATREQRVALARVDPTLYLDHGWVTRTK